MAAPSAAPLQKSRTHSREHISAPFFAPMAAEKTRADAAPDALQKQCSALLAKLRRNANAGPFLQPVDPEALGIPDYFEKIKQPMDLSTIKKKVDARQYGSLEEFNDDVELMFNNCFTYNAPGTCVYGMGQDFQAAYHTLYAAVAPKKTAADVDTATDTPKRARPTPATATATATATAMPAAPVAAQMPAEDANRAAALFTELGRAKNRAAAAPFWQLPAAEAAPDYATAVSSPIDLNQIKQRLRDDHYPSFAAFAADIRLVVTNALAYYAPDSAEHAAAVALQALVEPLLGATPGPQERIAELRRQISALTAELRSLESRTGASACTYSLSDRERIGRLLIDVDRAQAEKVAEIVQRHGAYEYADNDDIEINLQTMNDEVLAEIDRFMRRVKGNAVYASSGSSEE